MIKWIEDYNHFGQMQEKHKEFLVLLFYADFSSNAKRALVELENFSKENDEITVGDHIIYKEFAGTEVKIDEGGYILLTEDDLLAKYEAIDKIPE